MIPTDTKNIIAWTAMIFGIVCFGWAFINPHYMWQFMIAGFILFVVSWFFVERKRDTQKGGEGEDDEDEEGYDIDDVDLNQTSE